MAFVNRSSFADVNVIQWAQSPYRKRVPALIAVTYALIAVTFLAGLPNWLMLLGLGPYMIASAATFYELREKGRSGWWILLMLVNFSFGPTWVAFLAAALINLVPVLLALKPAAASDEPPLRG